MSNWTTADLDRIGTAAELEIATERADGSLRPYVTEEELSEAITHLAFYAGWPKAFAAMSVAKQVFASK